LRDNVTDDLGVEVVVHGRSAERGAKLVQEI
jgi:hypothetical protein